MTKKRVKEFLYVGYYYDIDGHLILKIGTTNNLERRRREHTRNYKKTNYYQMAKDNEFEYLWHLALSKYNTLRYEDRNRTSWQEIEDFEFIRNDRFILHQIPEMVEIRIRKSYQIPLTKFCV